MQIRRVLGFGVAVALLATTGPVLAQRNNNDTGQQQQQQAPMQADADTVTLVRLVDAVATGEQPAPADIAVTWESSHFIKGQDATYIPFTLSIDKASIPTPTAALYIRIVSKAELAKMQAAAAAPATQDGKPAAPAAPPAPPNYAWDNIHFIEVPADGKLARAVALQPGEYEAFIAVKERAEMPADPKAAAAAAAQPAPGKIGVLRRELTVPDFNTGEFQTSSVILANAVEPMQQQLSPAEQEANPYVFGPMRIVPAPGGRFSKSQELQVIFWIYGASAAAGGKPDVTVEYNFHQRLAEGEKYFNRTEPQVLNAETLPPEFSVAAGHQLPGSLVVGLTPFPVGDYRLEIKVTDKPSGKVVTQNVNFSVLPV